jgi:hypothetical protein
MNAVRRGHQQDERAIPQRDTNVQPFRADVLSDAAAWTTIFASAVAPHQPLATRTRWQPVLVKPARLSSLAGVNVIHAAFREESRSA